MNSIKHLDYTGLRAVNDPPVATAPVATCCKPEWCGTLSSRSSKSLVYKIYSSITPCNRKNRQILSLMQLEWTIFSKISDGPL